MRVSFASFLAVACLASASSTPPAKDGNLAARRLPVVTEDTLARPATSGCAFNEYLTYNKQCIKCTTVDPQALTCSSVSARSCRTGYVVYSGRCVTNCPDRFYARDGVCTRCSDSDAKTCNSDASLSCIFKNLYNGACISQCPDGTFTTYGSHVCSPCGTNQATCDKNGALTCKKGYLYNKACGDSCPSGTYADKKALQCVPCSSLDPNAATCQYTSTSGPVVKSCTNDYGLSNGACVKPCPARTYRSDNGVCTKCKDADALACTSDAATKCTFRYLTDGRCSATCPDGTFADWYSRTCKVCQDPDAATCSSTKALSCKTKLLSIGACVDSCPDGSVANTDTHSCGTCPGEDVATCDAVGATSCRTGYLYTHNCFATCPAATYPDETEKKCFDCDDGVTECTADADLFCGTTKDGEKLYLEGTKCVKTCSAGTYANGGVEPPDSPDSRLRKRAEVGPACVACPGDGVATCSSANVALSCKTNAVGAQTYLDSSTKSCVVASECPTLTFGSSADGINTCAACPTGSTACDANGKATACAAPKLLSDGKCVDTCPTSTFKKAAVCAPCGPWATRCISADIATACGKNNNNVQTYLLNGKCALAQECPSWGYISEEALACKRCDTFSIGSVTCNAEGALTCGKLSGVQQYLTSNKNCVSAEACPASTWANSADNTCTACDEGTKTCSGNGAGKATACLTTPSGDAYYLDTATNTCGQTCAESLFPDSLSATCLPCDDGEKVCTKNGEGSAVVCKSGRYLTPTFDCVTSAGCAAIGPYYGNDNTVNPVCSTCDDGVLACTGTGPGAATKCGVLAGTQLYLDPTGTCVDAADCPLGTFVNDVDNTCAACGVAALVCNSATDATVCGALEGVQYYLDAGICVLPDQCHPGTGAELEFDVCQDCEDLYAHSETCSTTEAETCVQGWYLHQGACIASCPDTTFTDEANRKCVNCKATYGAFTKTCSPSDTITCEPNNFRKNGVGACASCQTLFGSSTNTCTNSGAQTCLGTTYVRDGTCQTCLALWGSNVATCNANAITSCSSGAYQRNGAGSCQTCAQMYGDSPIRSCNGFGVTACQQVYYGIVDNVCRTVYTRWPNLVLRGSVTADTNEPACIRAAQLDFRSSWYQNTCRQRDSANLNYDQSGSTLYLTTFSGQDCSLYNPRQPDPAPSCTLIYQIGDQCKLWGSNNNC